MSWLQGVFSRRQMAREAAEEIAAHVEEKIEELVAAGMPREEAQFTARRAFGNVTLTVERSQDVWRWNWIEQLVADFRYAVRQLRKAPVFAVASVLTLALGIGANTAVFSVVNAVVLRPLPFEEADRLVAVQSRNVRDSTVHSLSYPTFFDFRRMNRAFEHLVSFRDEELGLSGAGTAVNLRAEIVSWDLFDALRVRMAAGRGFLPEEEKRGMHSVVLGYQVWTERFGADPGIVGRQVILDRRAYTVVGVAPQGFNFPVGSRRVQVWTTLAQDADSGTSTPTTEQRGARMLGAIARLRPGISVEKARAGMDTIAAALAAQYPDDVKNLSASVVLPALDAVAGGTRTPMLFLLGAVGMVLLIACANVASLLLARTTERQHEFAVRASIGAGRGRIARQLLTECATLAVAGAGAGVLAAIGFLRAVTVLAGSRIPRIEEARVDGTVLAFAIGLTVLTSLLTSLLPALRISRAGLAAPLREGSRGNVGGKDRLQNALVVAQIAMGLVLLSGASLFASGFLRLMGRDVGFRPEGLLTFRVGIPDQLQHHGKHSDFETRLLDRVSALPGVLSASVGGPLPLGGHQITIAFNIEDRPSGPSDRSFADMAIWRPGMFRTLGIPLLEGRGFTEQDDAQSLPVLIVNRAFARRFFPGERVIGKRIEPGATADGTRGGMREIVGVVGDALQDPMDRIGQPIYYYAEKQLPWCCAPLVVRVAGSPLALESSIRSVVASLDQSAPVYDVRTVEDLRTDGIGGPRFLAFLLGTFAAIALVLTAVGLFGVLSYSVMKRTREIGVRVALGADRASVLGMVLREAGLLVAVGVLIGLAGGVAGGRIAGSLVEAGGIPPAASLALACGVLVAAAALAAYLPARRAASVDPMRALRSE